VVERCWTALVMEVSELMSRVMGWKVVVGKVVRRVVRADEVLDEGEEVEVELEVERTPSR
jgi:hypothetical protein